VELVEAHESKLWQGVFETVAQVVNIARHIMEDWTMANVSPVESNRDSTGVNNSTVNSTKLVVRNFEQQHHPGMFPISWQRPHQGRV